MSDAMKASFTNAMTKVWEELPENNYYHAADTLSDEEKDQKKQDFFDDVNLFQRTMKSEGRKYPSGSKMLIHYDKYRDSWFVAGHKSEWMRLFVTDSICNSYRSPDVLNRTTYGSKQFRCNLLMLSGQSRDELDKASNLLMDDYNR